MKIRLLLLTLACGLVAAPIIRAEDGPPPRREKEPQTELGEHMEKISGAYRALRRQVADPTKNEDSLKRVAVIRENAEAALKLEPALTKDKPADQQAQFVEDFHAKMKDFLGDVDKLDAAFKSGNNEEAAKLLQVLNQDQKDGHQKFQKKKKRM